MTRRFLYKRYIKRILDIVLSAAALVVLSPLLAITAILVRIKLGTPVVFKQPRPGKGEKIFYLLKFRSMTNEIGEDGRLLPDKQRLTKFGRFLRASSLDELLELVNIVKGDMSIVGPRPLSIYYLPHYPRELRCRHNVRPGLTGLAQVNGRNNLPWDSRFAMDINYVDHLSFLMDVKIICDTAFKVLKRVDVSVRGTTKVTDYGPYTILREEGNKGTREDYMTYSEIGSYFWMDGSEERTPQGEISWLPAVDDSTFTFSGRNAIDVALRDILRHRSISQVYAPSYCCVSMLQAFIDRGMKIEFYDVDYCDGSFTYQIPNVDQNSLVLIMSYFGLNRANAHAAIEKIHRMNAVIIEDITHSLLCGSCASSSSDYLVASLRKWFAIPTGGWVGKRNGNLSEKPSIDGNQAVEEKISAMKEKYDYLTGKIADKEDFLLAQAKFDNDLIHVDRMLKIDDTSMGILLRTNIEETVERRRANVEVLLKGLQDLTGTMCSIPCVDTSTDVLLFLPIFMETDTRDSLRSYLISKGIYCPVHWSEVMGAPVGIRENELSLICDQRYSEGDMQAIVDCIHDWYRAQQVSNKERTLVHQ